MTRIKGSRLGNHVAVLDLHVKCMSWYWPPCREPSCKYRYMWSPSLLKLASVQYGITKQLRGFSVNLDLNSSEQRVSPVWASSLTFIWTSEQIWHMHPGRSALFSSFYTCFCRQCIAVVFPNLPTSFGQFWTDCRKAEHWLSTKPFQQLLFKNCLALYPGQWAARFYPLS